MCKRQREARASLRGLPSGQPIRHCDRSDLRRVR